MIRWLFLLLILLGVQGCSLLSSKTSSTSESNVDGNIKADATTVSKPFELETLYSLLVAEIAGNRQQYNITLSNYMQQARKTQDVRVIARAAHVAQFLRAHQPALDMGMLWLTHEPDSVQANTIVATRLTAMGRLDDALSYAEKVYEEGDSPLFETIALQSRKSDASTRDSLIEHYHRLSAERPEAVSIKVGLSTLYMLQNDPDKALATVKKARRIDPDHVSAVIQHAKILHVQEKYAAAINTISDALEKDPDNHRLRLIYARLLAKTDAEAAYQEFAHLSNESPGQLDFKFSQALLALELKDYQAAQPLLLDLYNNNYKPDDTAYYLGLIAEHQRQFDQALAYYLKTNKGANFLPAQTRAAKIMVDQGELQATANHFIELRKSHKDRMAELYAAEVGVLMSVQQHQRAIDVLDEAVALFPDNIPLRYNRALLYEKADKIELTEADLRHILTLDADNVLALNALGYFLASYTERYQEALEMVEKALELRPDDPAIMDSMGWVMFHLGNYEQALDYLRKALAKMPDGEIAAHLGEVLWTMGDTQAAEKVWRQGLVRQPNDPRILKTLERLDVNLTE